MTRALFLLAFASVFGCSSRADVSPTDASFPDVVIDGRVDESRCTASGRVCVGDEVHACIDDEPAERIETCGFEACYGGACLEPCAAARARGDSVGCEYWAADLDNAIEVVGLASRDDCSRYGAGPIAQSLSVCEVSFLAGPGADEATLYTICQADGTCPGSAAAGPFTPPMCETKNVCAIDAQNAAFGLVLANPDPEHEATVTITSASGASRDLTVAGGDVATFVPGEDGLEDQSLDGSGVERGGFRIVSSRPIVAYQINPISDEDVSSNDGSLLLAEHALGTDYIVSTMPSLDVAPPSGIDDVELPGAPYAGYATVIATAEGTTEVTIEAAATIQAGAGFDAIAKGESRTIALQQYDALTLEAAPFFNPLHPAPVEDGDLTGTRIHGDHPIAVFVGHEGSILSEDVRSPTCCADHLEEQLLPIATWGTRYAIARSAPRGAADRLRIVAAADGTVVTISPAPDVDDACPVLDVGDYCDVNIQSDVDVEGSRPILVMHYLLSAGPRLSVADALLRAGSLVDSGDPSMSVAVPSEQFRERYTFYVPERFSMSHLFVVAPEGTDVLIDGSSIATRMIATGGSAFIKGRVTVGPGPHRVECDGGCGVQVAGWSTGVSYMFPAGLRLQTIAVF